MSNATNSDAENLGGSSTQGAEESGLGELMGGVDPGTTDLGDDSYRTPTNAGTTMGGGGGGTTGGDASGATGGMTGDGAAGGGGGGEATGGSGGAGETGTSGTGTD